MDCASPWYYALTFILCHYSIHNITSYHTWNSKQEYCGFLLFSLKFLSFLYDHTPRYLLYRIQQGLFYPDAISPEILLWQKQFSSSSSPNEMSVTTFAPAQSQCLDWSSWFIEIKLAARSTYGKWTSKHKDYQELWCIPREWPEEGVQGNWGFPNISALEDWEWQEVAATPGRWPWGHGGGNCVFTDG